MSIFKGIPEGLPAVKYFEILGEVINGEIELIAAHSGPPRNELVSMILSHASDTTNLYRKWRKPSIPFDDPLRRLAYLYMYVAANAYVVEYVLKEDPSLKAFITSVSRRNSGVVKVCSLGAGPGTELLGLAKWIEQEQIGDQIILDPLLCDQETGWGDNWVAIRDQMRGRINKAYGTNKRPVFVLPGDFHRIDVEDVQSIGDVPDVRDQDLYLVSYVVSHVFDNFDNMNRFFCELIGNAPPRSKFIFIDRRGERWQDKVTQLAKSAPIQFSETKEASDLTISRDEEKSDLGAIFNELV